MSLGKFCPLDNTTKYVYRFLASLFQISDLPASPLLLIHQLSFSDALQADQYLQIFIHMDRVLLHSIKFLVGLCSSKWVILSIFLGFQNLQSA